MVVLEIAVAMKNFYFDTICNITHEQQRTTVGSSASLLQNIINCSKSYLNKYYWEVVFGPDNNSFYPSLRLKPLTDYDLIEF